MRRVLQTNQAFATGLLMRFGCSSVCPLSFGSPFTGPRTCGFLLFFHVLYTCLHVLSSSLFSSLACAFARTLVCAHTRVLYSFTKLGSSAPGSMQLGMVLLSPFTRFSLHWQLHTACFVCFVSLIFHLSLLREDLPRKNTLSGQNGGASFLGRMEATRLGLKRGLWVFAIAGLQRSDGQPPSS